MKKLGVLVLVILAVLSLAVAYVYFTKTAANLPHFFLGYSKALDRKHEKHGIAFAGLAVVLLLAAWMASGKRSSEEAKTQKQGE